MQREALIAAFAAAFEDYPELRLGQLVVNVVKPANPCPEIFYITNEEFFKRLMEFGK